MSDEVEGAGVGEKCGCDGIETISGEDLGAVESGKKF